MYGYKVIEEKIRHELDRHPHQSKTPGDIARDITPLVIELLDEAFREGRVDMAQELVQLANQMRTRL